MGARKAKFADIPGILALMHKCLGESRMAGTAEIDEICAKELMMTVIGNQSDTAHLGGLALFVTGEIGEATGLIAGSLQPMYFALSQAVVTDHLWYIDPDRAGPRDGMRLLAALHEWADTYPDPVTRQHMVNDMVMSPEVTGRMMHRKGYRVAGLIFEKEA